ATMHSRTFFFSSRRRHTSFSRDWSSDVCSSDLFLAEPDGRVVAGRAPRQQLAVGVERGGRVGRGGAVLLEVAGPVSAGAAGVARSEERRVGKERRAPWCACDAMKWPGSWFVDCI